MTEYVLGFSAVDPTKIALVGGKGAHLGELSRLEGIRVPPGYCVTTRAFQRVVASVPGLAERLARVTAEDCAEVRAAIEAAAIPEDIAAAIVEPLDERVAYAVRSSATAEDLPSASFAGQHDTFLNVVGAAAILAHVKKCWASLFTERAVTYRRRNDFDHRKVEMAVVVQRMASPRASGVMFTADPVTSNRRVVSIEATFGLGEALVSGVVNADGFRVRDGAIVDRTIRQVEPTLRDDEVLELARLGRRIEAQFGAPQDIEWCAGDDGIQFVQSRAITTLFPIPAAGDDKNHVYLSVGHQQMMTDPMKPLGLSVWQHTAGRPMHVAGGRLFVDVTQALASPPMRAGLFAMAGKSDPLIADALKTILDRGDFIREEAPPAAPAPAGLPPAAAPPDPAIVPELVARANAALAASKEGIRGLTGPALLDFILADLQDLKRLMFDPQSFPAIMAGIDASWWLNDKLHAWLGETNAADKLTLSAPNNVTSEMGLALLDVADVIRPHREVVALLERVERDDFLDELAALPGGREARDAIVAYLDRYGMRCVGEIDITRPRWSERPSTLVPPLLANVRGFTSGEAARRFARGRQEALDKERDVLARVRALPDGEDKARETKEKIDRVRAFIGYREFPKYAMISRYFVYKRALVEEAERLVAAGVLRDREDIFYLSLEELRDAVRERRVDAQLVRARADAFRSYAALVPPRVLTSDGEAIAGSYRRDDVPAGALVGLAVSAGTVEGRARVVLEMTDANLEDGDILVTAFTDPSWTPVFVSIRALVTEVGGLMTHGAVVAREYGVPAVVGVAHATRRIRDGQRIRVHGTAGYVELL